MPRRGASGKPLTPAQRAQRSAAAKASAAKRKAVSSHSIKRIADQSIVKGHKSSGKAADKHYARGDHLHKAFTLQMKPQTKGQRKSSALTSKAEHQVSVSGVGKPKVSAGAPRDMHGNVKKSDYSSLPARLKVPWLDKHGKSLKRKAR
jgi:hypothetical protein